MTLEEQVRADPRFATYPPEKQQQLLTLARQKSLEQQTRADPRFAALKPEQQMQAVGTARRKDLDAGLRTEASSGTVLPGPPPTPESTDPPTRSLAMEALPVGGAIVGAMATGPAAPVGAALGAGIGEEAAQTIESLRGQRQQADVPGVLRQAGEQGAMEAVGGPVLRAAGRAVKTVGGKIVEASIPRSMYEARLVQAYRAARPFWERVTAAFTGAGKPPPQTVAKTLVEQGLAGTEAGIGVQAKRATRSLWNDMIQPALRSSAAKVDLGHFFDEVESGIKATNPELARQADLVEALQSLRDAYKGVGEISLEQLQKLKRGWAKFVPEKAYMGKPIAGAFNDVKDMAADLARRKIYTELGPDVRQAYLDYGNLLNVMEHGQRAMTGGRLRGGFGGFWSAIKDMAVTPVSTIGGQVVYRVGKATEHVGGAPFKNATMKVIGPPGARVLRDAIPGAFEVGRPLQRPDFTDEQRDAVTR